ncbi:GMC family oxidoreductase [Sinimarinibacterium thermocellulolyticum]|uniref:GMC family oxidoreductase N-terminal domain-containing protein n=1 Tax=Sinimarinibacterium thermocellulolyticum TaxID=3170016 RepID=A0ABV2ADZ5_9GAMM
MSTLDCDVLILGGGTAGSVLAARLTEDPRLRVTLVEAGGEAGSLLVQLPVGFARLITHPRYDWCYRQVQDPSIHGRRFIWSAGKLLGGSSSINGQVYIRGMRQDYDRWVAAGARGWGFDNLLPYFRKSEDWTGTPHPAHGQGGPMTVSPMREPHPLCADFIAACVECGLRRLDDYHDGDMEGVFLTVATQRNGWRCSSEKAFLRPARTRPNLRVLTHAEAHELLFEGRRAHGAVVHSRHGELTINARREVIVSCGTVGSAALLLRSGIGPGARLQQLGRTVLHDLPGVGQNLQEHPGVGQNRYARCATINSQMRPHHMLAHLWAFLSARKGVLTAPAVQAMGLVRMQAATDVPDVQLHFLPLSYDIEPDTLSTASASMSKQPTVTILTTLCHPYSRGHVEIDERGAPRIAHPLLGDQRDVDTLVRAQRFVVDLFETKAMQRIVSGLRTPERLPETDDQWAEYVRWKAAPAYHPVGTCRIGIDSTAVVDPSLRVHGIDRLRVIDASVMPLLPSTNTNAPTLAIAERGADLVRQDLRENV